MDIEKLMQPRWKVINDYPNSPYELNSVLGMREIRFGMGTLPPESYPAIFKKLQWWEEIKNDEMPEYVKWEGHDLCVKIIDQAKHTKSDVIVETYGWVSLYDMIPATKEEYDQFINQK